MKAVILAGGMGTRLREETEFRPKPMVEIGGRDKKEEWKNSKTVCNTEEELIALIKEYNALNLDN